MSEVLIPIVLGAFCILFGLAIIVPAVTSFFKSLLFRRRAQRCSGRVIDVQQMGKKFQPLIEYVSPHGSQRLRPPSWSAHRWNIGDEAAVAYDPENPGDARLIEGLGDAGGTFASVLAGALFLGFGVLALVGGIQRPAERKKEEVANRFIAAAGRGDINTVRQMVTNQADLVNAEETNAWVKPGTRVPRNRAIQGFQVWNRPLHAAAKGLHADVVELLLDRGADANATISGWRTALHEVGDKITYNDDAASARRLKIIELLIARGANVNARSKAQKTPLHENASDPKAVELLLARGADVNARDDMGRTPLLHAAATGWDTSHAVQLLLDHGADIHVRDHEGNTPLLNAVWAFSAPRIELLLSRGADANVRNDAGTTALHIAADSAAGPSLGRGLPTLALLCSYGLRPDIRDNSGKTPIDIARAKLAGEDDPAWMKRRRAVAQFLSPNGTCNRLARRAHEVSQDEIAFIGADAACAEEDTDGCAHLGFSYDTGKGVAIDQKRAAELYTKACAKGSYWACGALGYLYSNGEGVAADEPRAAKLYRQACDGGEMTACSNLAGLYMSGSGVAEDRATALALYRKACDGGDADACHKLRNGH